MKLYLASSWRNKSLDDVVTALRRADHVVFDFRNPRPLDRGFHWSEIDPAWKTWTPEEYLEALQEAPLAKAGFASDKAGLDWCEGCVLVLPCGRSAHLELGYVLGTCRPGYIILGEDGFEPELMYLLASRIVRSVEELLPLLEAG